MRYGCVVPHEWRSYAAAWVVLLSSASQALAQDVAAARELAKAEEAFAAMSPQKGVTAAFLAHLADDSILFRPGPVDGKAVIAARPDPPIVLTWRPQRVLAARSGELGYSTGPWKIVSKTDPSTAQSYGQFFSIWRKNARGVWQVLVDQGIEHPQASGWDDALELLPAPDGARPEDSPDVAEAEFAQIAQTRGLGAAYQRFGARELRLLREGHAPAARVAAEALVGAWSGSSLQYGVAASKDLAWVVGRYAHARANGSEERGHYVRVWLAEGGAWKISVDVLSPSP